ncbi:MAG: CotD family spore coat protein [Bacilli bacterium]|nr:CotD family spore coat protein [Bacilli bacterium]MDD3304960.1 CotD family spore coat protein [Bacilli bacterium]MDD4054073.1 CotD family spore coat protein [Bacilli bacterium]MDD4411407.1 CotD family spore coat protein [Bacilli bacterium]
MLFNRRECCGMMGPEPFIQLQPEMSQDDFDERDCCGMMGQGPFMQPRQMMPQFGFDGADCGCKMDPIIEQPIQRCVKRDICHDVQHVCPIHTKIINNHIYRHTYVPQYTCSEENTMCNLDQGSCCNFI